LVTPLIISLFYVVELILQNHFYARLVLKSISEAIKEPNKSSITGKQIEKLREVIKYMKDKTKKNIYRSEYTSLLYKCWNELPFAAEYIAPTKYTTSNGPGYQAIMRHFVLKFHQFLTYELQEDEIHFLHLDLPTEQSRFLNSINCVMFFQTVIVR
jgi:hypothetical protein